MSGNVEDKVKMSSHSSFPEYCYNFACGHPNAKELPVREMNLLFEQLSSAWRETSNCSSYRPSDLSFNVQSLQYSSSSAGNDDVKLEIAAFVDRNCVGDEIVMDDEFATNEGVTDEGVTIEGVTDEGALVDGGVLEGALDKDILDHLDKDILGVSRERSIDSLAGKRPASAICCCSSELFCTSGISHGLDLIVRACTNPGDIVYVERPTYFLATRIFLDHGLIVLPLPASADLVDLVDVVGVVEDAGLNGKYLSESSLTFDVDALAVQLERIVAAESLEGPPALPKLIYIVPTHHNPTGSTLPLRQRKKLLDLAARYDITIVADEVYHLLDWTATSLSRKRPARMAALWKANGFTKADGAHLGTTDRAGRVVSLWALTKIWCPGIRFGWIECCDQGLLDKLASLGYMKSAGCINPMTGELVKHLMRCHVVDNYLHHTLIPAYRRRCNIVCSAIKHYQHPQHPQHPQHHSHHVIRIPYLPSGGYFVWIQFPLSINADDFLSFCHGHQLLHYQPNASCSKTKQDISDRSTLIRLSTYNSTQDHNNDTCSLHFLPGAVCDPLQSNSSFLHQTLLNHESTNFCTQNLKLTSYARLCFAEMDDNTIHAAVNALLYKFSKFCENKL